MKLSTSTGDFSWYVDNIAQKVESFQGTKFKNINLEQTGNIPQLMEDGENWKRLADDWGNAAALAGVTFTTSHAPCLHWPTSDEETYQKNLRAICRSIEICHMLQIPRTVVHACSSENFSKSDFYNYNQRFYTDVLKFAEPFGITVMTENWDDTRYYFSTGKVMRDFIDFMDHPLLAACWDTAHGNIDTVAREIGQYENIVTLGDKLKGLHIADNFGDCHHHSWPFAGIISFDAVMQALLDVNYDGVFTFEASYTLIHQNNPPFGRPGFEYQGQPLEKLRSPSIELKKQAVDLLYEVGKYILQTYNCFEE